MALDRHLIFSFKLSFIIFTTDEENYPYVEKLLKKRNEKNVNIPISFKPEKLQHQSKNQ